MSGADMENHEPATEKERRRHDRLACDGLAEVVVFHSDMLFRGEIRDISVTGCYIATRAQLNLKRFAEVELRFSANGQRLSSLARVMAVRPGKGVGIEFVAGDPRMDKRFHQLLERLRDAPMPEKD